MEPSVPTGNLVRFGIFEADFRSGELRKGGVKLKLTGQPFQILAILLERPGEVVTREEIQKRLWPDTFVDADRGLNANINRIREVLGDSAESPRFVETLPRRGYRFIAQVNGTAVRTANVPTPDEEIKGKAEKKVPRWAVVLSTVLVTLVASATFLIYRRLPAQPIKQRTLTRITFDEGLQIGATWSPDGRFLAYSSNRGGKFDIWLQQLSGGDPVQITKGPSNNWQPDWSPDGKYIAYRSEAREGGVFVVPALGGEGLERKIAPFGYYPRWSPTKPQILFRTHFSGLDTTDRFYMVDLDGTAPHEVLADFVSQQHLIAVSAAWHPDGKRISVWASNPSTASPTFWTVPVAGGEPIGSVIPAEIAKQLGEVSVGPGAVEWATDFKFDWAQSGSAIYFERTFRGAKNLWKMTVDPDTLRATAIERLTTGPGHDTQLAISPDGTRLAFTGETQHIRAWVFPFDALSGRVSGTGTAVTSPGMDAWRENLSRDGKKLAFCSDRAGKWELWEKSLPYGREAPILSDDYRRDFPQWSPDGTHLAYRREKSLTGEAQIMIWSSKDRTEEPLTAPSHIDGGVFDWSPDGNQLLITQVNTHRRVEIWLLTVNAAPHAEASARKIIADPGYDFYQSHFSPDGQWIVFQAVANSPSAAESTLYVIPAAGGQWIRITDGHHWDDKPRWSPDGKAIYFVSGRGGFFNIWGIRFDSSRRKPMGEPFGVTAFGGPSLMIPDWIPQVELSLSQGKLVLSMAEVSGSIWLLDNVGP